MPSAPGPQMRLMHGIANGWMPTHMEHPPSKAVAQEFVAADKAKAKRMTPGQRAAMAKHLRGVG